MKPIFAVISLLGLAPLGQAFDLRSQLLSYPTSYLSGTATQVCVGQFTDDAVADAATLVGGNLVLAYAPERHASFLKTAGGFGAMTKVTLGTSGREGLLVSTNTGLSLASWNTSTRQLVLTSVSSDVTWASARRLETLRIGSSPVEHICGLSSSGGKLLSADWNGAQLADGSFHSITLTTPAITMSAMDWNGDALPDFAYDTGTGLWVVSSAGVRVFSYSNPCAQPQLLRMAAPGATDDLIWVTNNPYAAGQALTVVHSKSNSMEPALAAGSVVISSMALADIDRDGASDLVLTRGDDHFAQVLYHQSSGVYTFGLFSQGTGQPLLALDLIDIWSDGFVPVAGVGDIDGDADDDLYFAGQPGGPGQAGVWFGDIVNEERDDTKNVKPWITSALFGDWTYPEIPLPPAVDTAWLNVSFWSPSISQVIANATDVRVTVWVRDDDTGPVRPVALTDLYFPRTASSAYIPIPLPDVSQCVPRFIEVEFSYVRRNGAGTVLQSFPAWSGEIDRVTGIPFIASAGSTTTGGIIRPPPPPTPPGSSSSP